MNAGQVAASKMRKRDPTMRLQEARKAGTFNLYYSLYGHVSDFSYTPDREAVQSSFYQSEEWRRRIREQLERGFGIPFDFIEPEEWEDIPDYIQDNGPTGKPLFLDEIEGKK